MAVRHARLPLNLGFLHCSQPRGENLHLEQPRTNFFDDGAGSLDFGLALAFTLAVALAFTLAVALALALAWFLASTVSLPAGFFLAS